MKKTVTLSLLLLLMATASFAQKSPPLIEIVTAFYTRYSFDSYETYLKFQKKRDGWYVTQDYYSPPGKSIMPTLFWSAKEGFFVDIDYPSAKNDTSTVTAMVEKYMKMIDWDYEAYQFERNKYYGYPGWSWDVINDPVDSSAMSNPSWESLARAYSNYASGFIVEQYGDLFENNDKDRAALAPTDPVSQSRIDKFIFFETKAIEAYKKILKINPSYQIKVGNIRIKAANEYMFMYCDLIMVGDSINARKFSLMPDYPDSILNLYRSFLEPLPFNSIVIAGGDNDTYTFWYLQEAKKIRRDILVLNYSLLGLRKYLLMLDKRDKGKLFATKADVYLKNNFDYFLYARNSSNQQQQINVNDFIAHLNNNENPYYTDSALYKGEKMKTYFTKELYFLPYKSLTSAVGSSVAKVIALKDYMFMNEFIILDIINTNIRNRKIYFTYNNEFLSEILQLNGDVYEVSP